MTASTALSAESLDALRSGTVIVDARAFLYDIPVEQVRTDSMQSFLKQETIIVELRTDDGSTGVGYSYTIGTGGGAVLSLLRSTLLDRLVGLSVDRPEMVWSALYASTRATAVGVITSLALAAIDTAVWDLSSKIANRPLWVAAGGAADSIRLYDTEGGWLHYSADELVEHAVAAKRRGMKGVKVKVGKPRGHEDLDRLSAVRDAIGWDMDIMVDANQCFTVAEARRRAALYERVGIFWFEEPLPADDVDGHRQLAQSTTVPIAVGESMYSLAQFREYLQVGAASIVQADVARVGGVTPWLKIAHLAEAFNVQVAPHFLMELHVSLVCAVPNALYLEHIPQLRSVTTTEMVVDDGMALAPTAPGLGIDWDRDALDTLRVL
ncbi:mandelate racemase/muconate lactonizing enzyme family protein [Compostimonas suwonensis]|uniref:L-alanine-DL-glutamate epimerase-like enolase superfamily enzyme n=1 Tax=Compostimonas suwonensis TaxID=1048394 RepID=A0A2M9BVP4_9MICO|nr:mandelate racemase/muconate lactonizing enzyme family protein [Compostimonas suwonensis]PJJ61995.1 L-alanine-DL-glutamate epimerase-like enolase superfamily enzyme [Compostimonas suwonensis]